MSETAGGSSDGQGLLARISTEMVRTQKHFFGKGPTQAKSYFVDDMLIVVMQGGLTTAEKTMLEFGDADRVRDFRQGYQNHMAPRLTTLIEDLTGREVVTYQSQIMFDPDRVVEMFVFSERATPELIQATATSQIAGEVVGDVSPEDAGSDASFSSRRD